MPRKSVAQAAEPRANYGPGRPETPLRIDAEQGMNAIALLDAAVNTAQRSFNDLSIALSAMTRARNQLANGISKYDRGERIA